MSMLIVTKYAAKGKPREALVKQLTAVGFKEDDLYFAGVAPHDFPFDAELTKDDIRELAAIDVAVERRIADGLSESVRRLDMALQQKNWTTELVE